jgi:lysyl-tRNA synthetase, class II
MTSSSPHAVRASQLACVALVVWIGATVVLLVAPSASAHAVQAAIEARDATPWAVLADAALGAVAVVAGVTAHRTRTVPAQADASPVRLRAVQQIVDEYGEDSLAPFVVRPDKSFAFVAGGLIACRRIGQTVVVSGDPIGPEGFHLQAIRDLRAMCARDHLHVAIYGAGTRNLDAYRAAGLRAVRVGEEAIVNPAKFTLEGRAVRKLRQSVQRISGRGWMIDAVDGADLDDAQRLEIDELERRWQAGQERVIGFAMSFGCYERGAGADDLFLLARAPSGELRAVMRFLPHRGNLSLDTMRRVGETPNGLNEALVCRALEVARDRRIGEVSLNYAGLAHLVNDPDSGGPILRAARRVLLAALGRRFQLQRLVRFNDKFGPVWRPRYLVFESRRQLPIAIWRVLEAEGYIGGRRSGRDTVSGEPPNPQAFASRATATGAAR